MKNILKMLKQYKKESILGPLFKLFEAIFELFIPILIASLIDIGIKQNNHTYIIVISILLIVFPLIGLLFSIIAQYYSAYAAINIATNLRKNLFNKIQSLSYSEYDNLGFSSLINVMTSDVNQVQTGINLLLRLLLRSPIVVFGATIMALFINIKAGLIFLFVTCVLFLVVFLITKITVPLYKNVQIKQDNLLKHTRENLNGIRVIRAFNKQEDEVKEFNVLNKNHTKSQLHVGKIASLLNPFTYLIINGAIVLLIYFGALKVNVGDLSQGEVIALYNYMSIILVELIKFANLLITLNKSIACANRIDNIMKKESSLKFKDDKTINKSGYVVFDNVSLTYQNSAKESLKDISFSVNKGETIGIIGSTGSGKTSLINLLAHFYDTSEGNIYINGTNIANLDIFSLREMISIVPQKAVLFKGTIKENLLWGNKNAKDEEMIDALNLAMAKEFVWNKEKGLDSEVSQDGKNFSGGQRQRLTIARALLKKAPILILDDSTSALDYKTEASFRQNLKKLSYNPIVFIISQRVSTVAHADKIIVLDKGEMVGYGNHQQLLNNCKIYQEIYNSQVKKEDEIYG